MEEIQFFEKLYTYFIKDPEKFILFGSLFINVYIFREYINLLKDNVDISRKLSAIMNRFEIDITTNKVNSGSRNKILELEEKNDEADNGDVVPEKPE